MQLFLPALPEDQAFHSLDLSLNWRSLTHPVPLYCCWAQGPILGTLVGIYSATRQQGPQVAAPKAVIKSLLWVLWAGACFPESCLSPARSPLSLCTDLHSVMMRSKHPFSPSRLPFLLATLTQALLLLRRLPHSAQMPQVTSVSASVERSGEMDASMFSCTLRSSGMCLGCQQSPSHHKGFQDVFLSL